MTKNWPKRLLLDHYFKSICEAAVLWIKFSPVQSSYNYSKSLKVSEMGSFLILVVRLYSYKDSNVGNMLKIKYFHDYFRHSRKA